MAEPSAQVMPPQPKTLRTAKNSDPIARNDLKPAVTLKQPMQAKERKNQPIIDQPKIVEKSTPKNVNNTAEAEQQVRQQPVIQIEKAPEAKALKTEKVEVARKKKVATSNPYNGSGPNPNPLSVAPVVQKDALVDTEMVLKSKINLRAGPGSFFITIGSLNKGEIIKVLSCSFDWCKVIQVNDGVIRLLQGYVKSERLK